MAAFNRIGTASVVNRPLRRHGELVSLTLDFTSWRLLGAAMLACALLAAAVVSANMSAALSWRIRDTRAQLRQLTDVRTDLVSGIAALDDRETLLKLAEDSGMTAAVSVRYLVEDAPHTAVR